MSVWNYRPMRKWIEIKDQKLKDNWIDSHWVYWLHETYYSWDDDSKVNSWTIDSIIWYFSDVDDMIEELELMVKDAKKYRDEILDYDKKPRWNTKYQNWIRKFLNK